MDKTTELSKENKKFFDEINSVRFKMTKGEDDPKTLREGFYHKKIFKIVKQIYPDAISEVQIDNFFFVDIFVPSQNLIIEVLGPMHFNISKGLDMKTKLRGKIHLDLGYDVRFIE